MDHSLLRPLLPALLALLAGCAGAAAHIAPAATNPPSPPPLRTVFLIVMENHNWSAIAGNPAAPYINHSLLPSASYATQYDNPPGNHPSLPNYLWLEAGTNCFPDTGCIRNDGSPSTHSTHSRLHLADLLQNAGISWRAYEENITGTTCPFDAHSILAIGGEQGIPGLAGDLYAPRHDPFVYFDDVTDNLNAHAPRCIRHVRPFTQLASDLRHNTVARYNFITPNVCDDMHSPCPLLSNPIKQGDIWLSRVIPAIQRSRAYRDGGVIFITWDEASSGDGPIGMIVLSPAARGHGFHNAVPYTHSSTLRTIEEIFGVRPFLGGAARSNDLRALFRRFP
ncbi:MAG TPA: alkaline phosphatase family protein [Chloroflexota bacterium]|nr:alkaline phosphatase family protein [Chloroflexota bacterium]